MIIQLPVTTEVLNKNEDLSPNGKAEDSKIIIEFDTRKRDYHQMFKLKRKVRINWIKQRTFDVQELSGFAWPIIYRVTTWAIFEGPTTEAQAQAKLVELKQYVAHHSEDGYTKSISFLDEHFRNMTTFLRVPGVQRNSLAESGMRVLRRLERNHDGFRSDKARQNALKIYQAVVYLGWSIHNLPDLASPDG